MCGQRRGVYIYILRITPKGKKEPEEYKFYEEESAISRLNEITEEQREKIEKIELFLINRTKAEEEELFST